MSSRVTTELPNSLLGALKKGCPALLLTVGNDSFPSTAYTWVVATTPSTIHFGADHGSVTLANLERDRRASLQIISQNNLIYLVKGTTSQIKSQIEAAPFKIAMMALQVVEVKDQSWPGVTVKPLGYEWDAEQKDKMQAMEQAVYTEMREWSK